MQGSNPGLSLVPPARQINCPSPVLPLRSPNFFILSGNCLLGSYCAPRTGDIVCIEESEVPASVDISVSNTARQGSKAVRRSAGVADGPRSLEMCGVKKEEAECWSRDRLRVTLEHNPRGGKGGDEEDNLGVQGEEQF